MRKVALYLMLLGSGVLFGRLSLDSSVTAKETLAERGVGGASSPCADVNGDNVLDISDPVYLLSFLFLGGPGPECSPASSSCPDGYIQPLDDGTGRFIVVWADNPQSGACCFSTVAEARAAYPSHNFAFGDTNPCCSCPEGYISPMEDGTGRYRITWANDPLTGACCFGTVEEARSAYPTKRLWVGDSLTCCQSQ